MKNAIHMLHSITNTQMNSFLITTASGKIIAIDGGLRGDATYFLEYLRGVSGQEIPHIAVWFLTHPHLDHIDAFMEIMEYHRDALTVGEIRFGFPSVEFMALEDQSAVGTLGEFYRLLPLFADKVRFTSGGTVLEVGEAKFTVLYSHDSEFTHNVCNNSSLVFRLELGGKSAIFTGDCGVEAGQKILRMWGESGLLKADICQMAHHGQNGCDRAFYEAVSPEICLWCTPLWLWNNDRGKGFNTHIWKTVEVRGWMDEIGVKTNLKICDGTQVLELD